MFSRMKYGNAVYDAGYSTFTKVIVHNCEIERQLARSKEDRSSKELAAHERLPRLPRLPDPLHEQLSAINLSSVSQYSQ